MNQERIALFADLHSNLEAFDACLEHAQSQGATRFIFLGDMVGYNANPKEVLEKIMLLVDSGQGIAIRGNHDTACYATDPPKMNPIAEFAIEWTKGQIADEHISFMKELPLIAFEEDRCYVHASAHEPENWHYVSDGMSAWKSAEASEKIYTFSGHVHDQALYYQSSVGKLIRFAPYPGDAIPAGSHRRWVAIVGSLGQPRDNNPKANYLIFDPHEESMYFHRVAYNHHLAAEKVRTAGLPIELANCLIQGY
jgi:diadenosine tetraphosphatase ApaH/serine/threonine PP2A family protein phosphatase